MTNLAIFASGSGTNTKKIIEFFKGHSTIGVALVVSNNPRAGVLDIAVSAGIPSMVLEKEKFFRGDGYVQELRDKNIVFIALAGFLWKVPSQLIRAYPERIINIHPALLPKFGGKGMYGARVHEAVIAANEKQSGITIHYVDELYDHGKIIFQGTCTVDPQDTAETLARKIHLMEYSYFAPAIEQAIQNIVKT